MRPLVKEMIGSEGMSLNFTKLFISHASEDKTEIAKPLADALIIAGYKVWYDDYSLKLGDSLKSCIDRGLCQCDYGVVVLSNYFFVKHWTKEELDGLTAIESVRREKVILPVWHNIDHHYISKFSPTLAGKKGISTKDGIPAVVNAIVEALNARARSAYVHRMDLQHVNIQSKYIMTSGIAGVFDVCKDPSVTWTDFWESFRPEFQKLDNEEKALAKVADEKVKPEKK